MPNPHRPVSHPGPHHTPTPKGHTMTPRIIADYACHTGENPLWHPDHQCLYWTDIPAGHLYRYHPATTHHELCHRDAPIGGFTLQADGSLLLFMAQGAVKSWNNGHIHTLIDSLPDELDNRFNDVIADPQGRVYCGTMSPPHRKGRLYRLDPDLTLTTVFDNIGCSNGMGFTRDHKSIYYTDTHTGRIDICDYHQATGTITNRRPFVTIPDGEGKPDGMTVDSYGYVWGARWDGARIVRYAPDGTLERTIHLPVPKTSSLTFAGPDYTDIYITTAGGHNKPAEAPAAGALLHLNLGIPGLPEHRSRIGL